MSEKVNDTQATNPNQSELAEKNENKNSATQLDQNPEKDHNKNDTSSNNQNDNDTVNPEEEIVKGDWVRPNVKVAEVEVSTGEENEECFWKNRAKLYRWSKELQEWRERGLGEAKLMKNTNTGKIRFLLRQDKTFKVVSNHYVIKIKGFCELALNVGSDKIWVWTAADYADEESKIEQFALKFGRVEDANIFKEKFVEATKLNETPFRDLIQSITNKVPVVINETTSK